MCPKREKIKIIEYAQSLTNPLEIIAYTANGGRLIIRTGEIKSEQKTLGRLYSDGHSHFFSKSQRGLGEVFMSLGKSHFTPGMHCHNGKRGIDHPQIRHFGNLSAHTFVCTLFHGPRPLINGEPAECDHKNGDIWDCSAENLEWVTRKENIWRSVHVLQVLRKKNIDPCRFTGKQMEKWFKIMRTLDKYCPVHAKTFMEADYLRFYAMPFEEFKELILHDFGKPADPEARMEKELTRHMEK